ncbi:PadR family transcriptional regulator [Haladaptatus sp. ZSTT2]|uniref:PadR family transcriptional regulator n=1 Tax=Haladaptatus sp. ZSTT2 TaxID=3120515 RepID=UPI00300E7BF3
MNDGNLESVVESVQDWVGSERDWTDGSSSRTALVISCSMEGWNPQEPLWPVDAAWNLIKVQTLGNQAWRRHEGEMVLDGNIEHLRTQYDVGAVLVVGHTKCTVLEDAHEEWVAPASQSPAGIKARLDPLRLIVRDGFKEGTITESTPLRTVRCRLVEFNVHRQVQFLRQALPRSITVAGYVHDQDGVYGSFPDNWYLVALDGKIEPQTIRTQLPEDTTVHVASLLR